MRTFDSYVEGFAPGSQKETFEVFKLASGFAYSDDQKIDVLLLGIAFVDKRLSGVVGDAIAKVKEVLSDQRVQSEIEALPTTGEKISKLIQLARQS